MLGAVALLVPRRALLKEWAYAGAFFTYTGAIVSHLVTGYDLGELGLLAVLTALTVLSWTLRPPSRRLAPDAHRTAGRHSPDTPGVAHTIPVIGTGVRARPPRTRICHGRSGDQRWGRILRLIVRNLVFTVVVPGLGGVWVPWWILMRHGHTATPAAWEAVPIIAAGTALYVWCVWNFAAVGGGTPGPWDAPSRVVAAGPYRWVHNPIYSPRS